MKWVWGLVVLVGVAIASAVTGYDHGYVQGAYKAYAPAPLVHAVDGVREKLGLGAAHATIPAPAAVAAAPAGRPSGPPPVLVETAKVERRAAPIIIDAVGSVQPIASIQIKARIDTQVVGIHVAEGALVKEGDLLVTLDDRTLKAQVAQVEAQILRDRAQLEQAYRDRERAIDLAARKVTSDVLRDNAITAAKAQEAVLAADIASLDNLKAQLSFTRITAPVSGRIGSINAKVGAIVRAADTAPIALVNQIDPIYIAFAVPQATFYELRAVIGTNPVKVEATVGGAVSTGEVAFVENTMDLTTGTVLVKARMSNGAEQLWPGVFVPVKVSLGIQQNAVIVPTNAVQVGQDGSYVFVIREGRAQVVKVTIARTIGAETVVATGLNGGEDVVTSGQLRLVSGAPVAVRRPSATAGEPSRDPRG